MDRQMEFLQLWATACEGPIEFYRLIQQARGTEEARRALTDKAHEMTKEYADGLNVDDDEQFATAVCMTALNYVILLVAYGVFNDA